MKVYETKLKRKNVYATEYNSITEIEKDIMAKPTSKLFGGEAKKKEAQSSYTGTMSFTGTESFAQAHELFTKGWEYGAKELTKKLKVKNNSSSTELVRKTVYDIVGFQACVPRYLQGVPQSMINKRMVPQKQKVITLIKEVTYSANVTQQQILNDSTVFLQIVQAIEAQGIRVNIYCAFGSKTNNEISYVKVKIKGANERLNISKMAFTMAHPSFLRRILFRYIETDERLTNKDYVWGYGRPLEYAELDELTNDNEYIIKKFSTLENALNDIKTLNKH